MKVEDLQKWLLYVHRYKPDHGLGIPVCLTAFDMLCSSWECCRLNTQNVMTVRNSVVRILCLVVRVLGF